MPGNAACDSVKLPKSARLRRGHGTNETSRLLVAFLRFLNSAAAAHGAGLAAQCSRRRRVCMVFGDRERV